MSIYLRSIFLSKAKQSKEERRKKMPFVTEFGGLEITHDITRDVKDAQSGAITVKGNGLKPLKVGYGMHCDFNLNSQQFKDTVRRGQPDAKNMNWQIGGDPVWRVPTNYFNEDELKRFWEYYKMNQNQKTILVHYEPDIEDVEIRSYGKTKGYHLPLWLLEELETRGEFEIALKTSKVRLSEEKKLQPDEYEAFKEALKERKAMESDGRAEALGKKEELKEVEKNMEAFQKKATPFKKKEEVLAT